jgi:hypothetical protein
MGWRDCSVGRADPSDCQTVQYSYPFRFHCTRLQNDDQTLAISDGFSSALWRSRPRLQMKAIVLNEPWTHYGHKVSACLHFSPLDFFIRRMWWISKQVTWTFTKRPSSPVIRIPFGGSSSGCLLLDRLLDLVSHPEGGSSKEVQNFYPTTNDTAGRTVFITVIPARISNTNSL